MSCYLVSAIVLPSDMLSLKLLTKSWMSLIVGSCIFLLPFPQTGISLSTNNTCNLIMLREQGKYMGAKESKKYCKTRDKMGSWNGHYILEGSARLASRLPRVNGLSCVHFLLLCRVCVFLPYTDRRDMRGWAAECEWVLDPRVRFSFLSPPKKWQD
jgi:hypothetical protein